jgi:hypothetical protein
MAAAGGRAFPWVALAGVTLVNSLPLVGVLAFGWNVFAIIVLYWIENIFIGVAHAARIHAAGQIQRKPRQGREEAMFFAMHYGIFTLVHGVFVFAFFGAMFGLSAPLAGLVVSVLALAGWQAAVLFMDIAERKGLEAADLGTLMLAPYGRILALHLTILGGVFLVNALGQPVWAVAVLVGVKIAYEVLVITIGWALKREA